MDTPMANTDHESPTLESIPTEVLLHITSYLTTPEYGALRLTSKLIEDSIHTSFAREFFAKKKFMISEFSLQALLDISQSRFAKSLKHVIFGLERLDFTAALRQMTILRPGLELRKNNILRQQLDNIAMLNTSQDVEMLAEVFSNLTNLETVGMRDFNSRSRTRDHPEIEWRSYGVSTFLLETGIALERTAYSTGHLGMNERDLHISRTFLSLLRALGKSNSQAKNFEVILRNCTLQDHAFNIPKHLERAIEPVLGKLRTLFLDISVGFFPLYVNEGNKLSKCPAYLLRKFLSKVPHLEHLRLNVKDRESDQGGELLSWFSKPNTSVSSNGTFAGSNLEPPPPVDLRNLQQLDIGMLSVSPKVLLAIFQKFQATLHTVSLHKVKMLEHDQEKLAEKVNLWAEFFGRLSEYKLKLSAINLSLLSQELTDLEYLDPQRITFNNTSDPQVKRWAGADLQGGLRDFQNDMVVKWTPPRRPIDEDVGSSDGSDSGESD
ncbi:uncharacterized protein LY89DRAFT_616603 [Mollisia scopiformis]|uniref:F-box domain-containing protein n=1 Tax=Mollisia scopiformis TaxID=149040 RepID=A0A194X9V0_MOLSC|nr:uncharacterized protein LY89DRAFT_616603 [Mollisia scopiformis]KUJ16941.1 hypothetical protein LY89DRAFT_616603 [Mollisia scopiformis]